MPEQHYAPPPGPPPSYTQHTTNTNNTNDHATFAPPPGPPPSQRGFPNDIPPEPAANPPPYQNWMTIEDTSLLPPPPPLPEDTSPTNNASYDSAAAAHTWCAQHPIYTPSTPSPEIHALAQRGQFALERPPPTLADKYFSLTHQATHKWHIRTTSPSQPDTITLTNLPAYFAAADNPHLTGRAYTISYTIRILRISNANSGIAIGFAAKPYPPWRLPGWHRASLAVHGDDGRRFTNDPWGGRDFVSPFKSGQTITVGMTFSTTPLDAAKVKTTAWLSRNGRTDDWQIDEQRDQRDEGVDGLLGESDLYPAIGVFGGVELEVDFRR